MQHRCQRVERSKHKWQAETQMSRVLRVLLQAPDQSRSVVSTPASLAGALQESLAQLHQVRSIKALAAVERTWTLSLSIRILLRCDCRAAFSQSDKPICLSANIGLTLVTDTK